jgi:hypothetical protein
MQFLYYIAKIKTSAVLKFPQLLAFCFFVVLWSQSAPSSAKKGSYKKVITVSIYHSLYKNIAIIVSFLVIFLSFTLFFAFAFI